MLVLNACNKSPKEISSTSDTSKEDVLKNSEVFGSGSKNPTSTDAENQDVHTVILKEILPTQKYVYLKVTENNEEEYWIATLKQEVKIGETYMYTGGLLKTDFKSIEHNRVFDKLYLVNNIVPANHGDQIGSSTPADQGLSGIINSEKIVRKGSIRIADIVSNPAKYKNQSLQVSGKCVKINANIMDRNWIHIKDGSRDDYDFVVTSDKAIPVGHTITFKGKLTLDKDFGAGYKYDIILENGILVE
jgi:hypothetical protein